MAAIVGIGIRAAYGTGRGKIVVRAKAEIEELEGGRNRIVVSELPYQVNKELFKNAKSDALFMHCLPAYRGYEVTEDVIDGPNSVIFDEAENRLHAQKAVMVKLMK